MFKNNLKFIFFNQFEDEYLNFIVNLEKFISQIQNNDKLINDRIEDMLKNQENEFDLLKE